MVLLHLLPVQLGGFCCFLFKLQARRLESFGNPGLAMWISNLFMCELQLLLLLSPQIVRSISTARQEQQELVNRASANQTLNSSLHSLRALLEPERAAPRVLQDFNPDDVPTEEELKQNFSGDWLFHVKTTACYLIQTDIEWYWDYTCCRHVAYSKILILP